LKVLSCSESGNKGGKGSIYEPRYKSSLGEIRTPVGGVLLREFGSRAHHGETYGSFISLGCVASKLWEYCLVDERLTRRVAKDYKNTVKIFLKFSNGVVSHESIRAYLRSYLDRSPKTYNNQLCGLRAFIYRFLKHPDIMEGIKKAHEPKDYDPQVPSKKQLKKSFNALTDDQERRYSSSTQQPVCGVGRS